jgi:hypothetical protein
MNQKIKKNPFGLQVGEQGYGNLGPIAEGILHIDFVRFPWLILLILRNFIHEGNLLNVLELSDTFLKQVICVFFQDVELLYNLTVRVLKNPSELVLPAGVYSHTTMVIKNDPKEHLQIEYRAEKTLQGAAEYYNGPSTHLYHVHTLGFCNVFRFLAEYATSVYLRKTVMHFKNNYLPFDLLVRQRGHEKFRMPEYLVSKYLTPLWSASGISDEAKVTEPKVTVPKVTVPKVTELGYGNFGRVVEDILHIDFAKCPWLILLLLRNFIFEGKLLSNILELSDTFLEDVICVFFQDIEVQFELLMRVRNKRSEVIVHAGVPSRTTMVIKYDPEEHLGIELRAQKALQLQCRDGYLTPLTLCNIYYTHVLGFFNVFRFLAEYTSSVYLGKIVMDKKKSYMPFDELVRQRGHDKFSVPEYLVSKYFTPLWPVSDISDEAKITEAKITEAKIAQAKIAEAKIAEAKIAEAKIAEAKIAEAKIAEAKITAAKITAAKITKAKITKVKTVTQSVIYTFPKTREKHIKNVLSDVKKITADNKIMLFDDIKQNLRQKKVFSGVPKSVTIKNIVEYLVINGAVKKKIMLPGYTKKVTVYCFNV